MNDCFDIVGALFNFIMSTDNFIFQALIMFSTEIKFIDDKISRLMV
jgi:hypothetical protein